MGPIRLWPPQAVPALRRRALAMFWPGILLWSLALAESSRALFQAWWWRGSPVFLLISLALLGQMGGGPGWSELSGLAWLAFPAAFCLTWKYVTRPRSPGGPDLSDGERLSLLGCALLLPTNPAWLGPILALVHRRLRLVPASLHERLAIHLLIVLVSYLLLSKVLPVANGSLAAWLACLATLAGFYVRPGLAKMKAGPRPWSWIQRVQLHYQLLGAYQWGWWGFLSESQLAKGLKWLRPFNAPLAFWVVLSEVGMLFLPLCPRALLGSLMLFHLAYLLVCGAFFWENLVLLAGCWMGVSTLPSAFFTLPGALLFCALVPLYLRNFPSSDLTWWELPLVQRVWTEVRVGQAWLPLCHDWADPLERRFYIGFEELSPYPLLTHNLTHSDLPFAETEEFLKDANPVALLLKSRPLCAQRVEEVRAYLARLLPGLEVNREVLPLALRWLKAPRSYLAPGARGARYHGQGQIESIRLRYREVHYRQGRISTERDEVVVSFERVELEGRS